MPPSDLERFTAPPAQVHHAARAYARKVNQAAANVAHDNPQILDAFEQRSELRCHGAAGRFGRSASRGVNLAVGARFPLRGLGFVFGASQDFGESLGLAQQPIDLGQEGFSLFTSEGPRGLVHERGL